MYNQPLRNPSPARARAQSLATFLFSFFLLVFLAACGTAPRDEGLGAEGSWKKISDEKASFTISGTKTVRYGVGSTWVEKSITGTGYCGNWFFGKDPAPQKIKQCEVYSGDSKEAPPSISGSWSKVADEKMSFSVSGTQTVRYGLGSSWVEKSITGTGYCGNWFFGSDPVPQTVKVCEVATSSASAPDSPAPSEPAPSEPAPDSPPPSGSVTVNYQEDGSNIANPERGYYFAHVMSSSNPKVIDPTNIQRMKDEKITIFKRIYNLNTFKSSSISSSFLDWIRQDLQVVRDNGLKVSLRFAYNFNDGSTSDAPKSVVLNHIDQLKPILQDNADIIAFMDLGFIGMYGEGHSSTNGLDSDTNREEILERLLSALPSNRMIVVRVAKYKKYSYGDSALTEGEAFNGSNRSRVGHKNDCFTAETDNYGTYWPLDSKSLESQKNYLNQETLYLPQAGETCGYFPSFSECSSALKDLQRMHWSSIGRLDGTFTSRWSSQGCLDTITKRLGYRYKLTSGALPGSVNKGSTMSVQLKMTNDGFAGLYNPRNLELVLRNRSNGQESRLAVNPGEDVRLFLPAAGETKTLTLNASVPSGIVSGDYDLFLNLPDPSSSLNRQATYSIRLANTNMWESSTGYNKLGGVRVN
ncbi:MAG: DUF4832 domain-containing protein [Trueperaceae bacterium]